MKPPRRACTRHACTKVPCSGGAATGFSTMSCRCADGRQHDLMRLRPCGPRSGAHRSPRIWDARDKAGRSFRCGARMGGAKLLRFWPCLERGLALPYRVRGIERVVLGLRSLEQVKLHEAGNAVELCIASEPHLLKGFFGTPLHTKPIHRDEHDRLSWFNCCRRP